MVSSDSSLTAGNCNVADDGNQLLSSAPSATPGTSQPPRPARLFLKRAVIASLCAFLGLGAFWPAFCVRQANHRLVLQDLSDAEYWARLADVPWARSEDVVLAHCRISRRLGDPEKFASSIARAKEKGVSSVRIEKELQLFNAQSGGLREAQVHLSSLLTDPTLDNRDVCVSFVIGYLRNQRYPEAQTLVNAMMQDFPDDPFPHYVLGRIHTLENSLTKAEADFSKAVELSPKWLEPKLWLAELLIDTHRHREAMPLFRECLAASDLKARAVSGLAECLKAVGDFADSRKVLEDAIASGSVDAELLIALGRLDFEEGLFEKAEPSLSKAVQLKPWADDALFLLAQCHRQLGKTELADQEFARHEEVRKAITRLNQLRDTVKADPANDEPRIEAGELMLRFRDPSDGIVMLQSVLDKTPDNRKVHEILLQYFESVEPATDASRQQAELHRRRLKELE